MTFQDQMSVVQESSEPSEEEISDYEEDAASWISWYCSLKGNEFYCEVDEDYVQDDFNLVGLSAQVPYYEQALDLILDSDTNSEDSSAELHNEIIETAAELLYGLIHVRYILTAKGLSVMQEKFKRREFGTCPRVLCNKQACLPIGLSDLPRSDSVKLYCPLCEDCYHPTSKSHINVDGAFFGTTFAHLLLMTYSQLQPKPYAVPYVPKVFGFKLHVSALNRPEPKDDETRSMLMKSKMAFIEGKQAEDESDQK